ncbi:MAG: glycosyltransferase family 4 protein [Myxococcales bacterium]|nr:glycosyltransferase family 4 protein [Myxococcales bacterium]
MSAAGEAPAPARHTGSGSPLRIAIVGAFPFPLAQGSQVFARDQARALQAAGADVSLLCYGRGEGAEPDNLRVLRISRAVSPRSLRAGPNLVKPLADACLAALLVRTKRGVGFDAVLAHNVEAAVVALATRPLHHAPVIYVAHTLMGQELSSYRLASDGSGAETRRGLVDRALDACGRALDASLARRCDALLALSRATADALGPRVGVGRCIEVIPPGLAPGPSPSPAAIDAACARHQLEPGRFALYSGNLDGYQDLGDLAETARSVAPLPVVVATHGSEAACDAFMRRHAGLLRVLRVDAEEARLLVFACAVALLPRHRPGGFPIKLLTYMEAARAIVARRSVADGFDHGESAWLLGADDGAGHMADAVKEITSSPELARRLGRGARALLERRHGSRAVGAQTLALVRGAMRTRTEVGNAAV